MSYLNEDGEDTPETMLLSARVFAVALSSLLGKNITEARRTSGLLVRLPHQPDSPDDPHGTYLAVLDADRGKLVIETIDEQLVHDIPSGSFITTDPKPH
jgi:hypothetical protein